MSVERFILFSLIKAYNNNKNVLKKIHKYLKYYVTYNRDLLKIIEIYYYDIQKLVHQLNKITYIDYDWSKLRCFVCRYGQNYYFKDGIQITLGARVINSQSLELPDKWQDFVLKLCSVCTTRLDLHKNSTFHEIKRALACISRHFLLHKHENNLVYFNYSYSLECQFPVPIIKYKRKTKYDVPSY